MYLSQLIDYRVVQDFNILLIYHIIRIDVVEVALDLLVVENSYKTPITRQACAFLKLELN